MDGTGSRGIRLGIGRKKDLLGDGDRGTVLQLFKAAVGYHISHIQPLYFRVRPFTYAWLDVMDVGLAVLDQKDKRGVSVVLDRRGRNQDHVVEGFQEQAGIYKQIRKENAVFVVENGAQLQRAGGGVDLVVDALQFSRRQLGFFGAIVDIDRQGLAQAHLLLQCGHVVFRDGEDNGNRLQLADDYQRCGARSGGQVAGVDQAKTHTAVDGRSNVGEIQLHLVELQSSLIGLDQSLVLKNEFFLVIQGLFRDGIARPGILVAFQIHL